MLPRPPGEHRRVLLARSLDEHLFGAADPRLVGGEGAALDDDAEAVETLPRHRRVDETVGDQGRLGARTRREDEREGVVEARLGGHFERRREVVVGLARGSRR